MSLPPNRSQERPGRRSTRSRPPLPPAARSDDPRQGTAGNLPASVSSFLGRDQEVGQLAKLLDGSRLVTLTGPPGIGKSRLALELAGRRASGHADGAWLAELTPIGDAGLVPRALASTLSVQELPATSLTDALVAHLVPRDLLLVLDNCEHLVGACAQIVDVLLAGCPQLRILATSREPLSASGEEVWQVPPRSVPTLQQEL